MTENTNTAELPDLLAETEARCAKLEAALVAATAEHAAGGDQLLANFIARHSHVVADGDVVRVQIVDERGRGRIVTDGGKFRAMSPRELAHEAREMFSGVFGKGDPGSHQRAADHADASPFNLTAAMSRIAEQRRAEAGASNTLSATDRDGSRSRNPWLKSAFNLTEQMKIQAENPTLAAALKAQAEGA